MQRILKAEENRLTTYNRTSIRLMTEFSSETWKARRQ
jgi:hypothetical protein